MVQSTVLTTRRILERLAVHYISQRMAWKLLKGILHSIMLKIRVLWIMLLTNNQPNNINQPVQMFQNQPRARLRGECQLQYTFSALAEQPSEVTSLIDFYAYSLCCLKPHLLTDFYVYSLYF